MIDSVMTANVARLMALSMSKNSNIGEIIEAIENVVMAESEQPVLSILFKGQINTPELGWLVRQGYGVNKLSEELFQIHW